jgi:hypothetical protein
MQQAARIPRRAARHPGCRGQAVLPDGDLLAGERVELPYTPVRPDEPADQVLAVLRGAETDILRGLQSDAFDRAIVGFSAAYADQNERDFEAFTAAVGSGRLTARTGL